ncbi:DNA-binding transcriptional regulator [Desulfopila sp. IMCC35006]|uniref:helix-turn-helix domain-containing protein n=1 Tax=Desulfopila sp. IMCC35006 TaxID=2569542 RepID=UPI001F102598|nr:helix-turn-helix domain-containing protein [Desulfopila sp. IMCC35006]
MQLLTKEEFSLSRKKLGKTQKKLAELLGMSLKTIHSYEQGWRTIPAHIERHLYFLLINQRGRQDSLKPCWEKKLCNVKEECPAWEFQSGHLCWFLSGTLCECTQDISQKEKLKICKQCDIFTDLMR